MAKILKSGALKKLRFKTDNISYLTKSTAKTFEHA